MICDWVIKLKAADRPAVYRAILELMVDEDLAISLAGFKAMRDLIEDWEFVEDQFFEFVEPCFQCASAQIQNALDHESQVQVS